MCKENVEIFETVSEEGELLLYHSNWGISLSDMKEENSQSLDEEKF